MEIAAIIIGTGFGIHLLILLIRYMKLDNNYNQNICTQGGRLVGDSQMVNGNRLMYERNDQTDTVVQAVPRSQVTSSFTGVNVRLFQMETGQCFDYYLDHQLTIGRAGASNMVDIPLNDVMVSQKHCCIYRQGEQIILQDLGSTNHTYLNGCQIEGAMPLTYGDMLKIGRSTFQFQYFV